MRIVVVASFLNEEELLPRFLASMRAQSRTPDLLLLVDDGSSDGSPRLAAEFAREHGFATALTRPPRPPEADRLASAAELKAFEWGVEQIDRSYDVMVKMDTDLELSPSLFATVEAEFAADPELGIAGAFLSAMGEGDRIERERGPAYHVRGPNKFYRRDCFERIQPIPPFLGWDTIDEAKARMLGWRTRSVELPDGDAVHLRPVGQHDGRLRAYRRWGRCAYGYGADPLYSVLVAASYARHRPPGIASVNYLWGWLHAYLRRAPRADVEIRRFVRAEQRAVLRAALRRGGRDPRVVSPAQRTS